MLEIELKNPDVISIKTKDRCANVNVAQSEIDAELAVGTIAGAGEFEFGDIVATGLATKEGGVIYRIEIGGIKLGLVGREIATEELDELGPIDILGTASAKAVSVISPKIVIPMGNLDFAELKAPVKSEKKLKIKKQSDLPATLEIWHLG